MPSPAGRSDHDARPGSVALVTGAADPVGIGAACARALAARHCAVGLIDVRPCDEVADALRATGASVATARADLADATAIDPAVDAVDAALGGPIAILVNCAADLTQGTLQTLDAGVWQRVLAVNVVAAALLARRVARGMARGRFGRIVNIASDTFDRPPALGLLAYITSKGGVVGLTRALALELGPAGITVNAISPGLTATAGAQAAQPSERFTRVREGQAIKRTIKPDDYAGILDLLVSARGEVITGQTIRADAGLVMV